MPDTAPFDPALFTDAAIDAETAALNAQMIELLTGQPEWWVTGAGNPAELAVYPGGAHGFTLFPNALSKAATARVDVFLNRVLA